MITDAVPIQKPFSVLQFSHSKDHLRRISVKDSHGEYDVWRLAPMVIDWPSDKIPDEVNPRSHDEVCLKSKVAHDIETTLREYPEDFWLANRGGYVLAQSVKFNPEKSIVVIEIADPDIHGIADGGTTNAVIKKLQAEMEKTQDPDLRKALSIARFNIDVVVGLSDHERIEKLVQGRNRSIQVKEWTMADFKGKFDWLKEFIERADAPFKNRIGWEENAGKSVSVLDLISLMLLFHPIYDDPDERRRQAPTGAYGSKGINDRRFSEPNMQKGFRQLCSVLEDIIRLHDYVYSNFEPVYERYNKEVNKKASKLARRKGFEQMNVTLPMTDTQSEYKIDKGLLFPLLASFRSLLNFDNGKAVWQTDPKEFFNDYGPDLMAKLIELYELCGRNPATTGKTKTIYSTLYSEARFLLSEKLNLEK